MRRARRDAFEECRLSFVRGLRLITLLLLAATASLAAASPFGPERPASGRAVVAIRSDGTKERFASSTDGSRLRLIVEFTTPPLARTPLATRSIARYEPMFARFREDLRRIAAPEIAKRGSQAITPEVSHEYFRAFSGVAVSVAPSQRAAIALLPYVRSVYPDVEVHATDAEPGTTLIRADEVWSRLGSRGAGVTVAIIDSGIDYMHPALGGGFGPGFKVAGGYDFVNGDNDPMDDRGHGTHVAGIVAANAPDLTGVAPDATLLAYKVLDGNGVGLMSDVVAGIERSVDPNGDGDLSDHADVANVSLGGPGYAGDPPSRAVDAAVAAGVVFVVAAGNEERFQTIGSPGTAASAITVGACDLHDALAPFSSKGPGAGSYGIKPDVVAPGVDVRSAKAGGGTLVASGTSMATPHVAGAAALLRSLHRDWTPAEIKSALVTTATPVAAEVMAAGAGRIDVFRAATLTTRAAPSQLAFGLIDGKAASWSGTQSFVLANRGTSPRTYEFVPGGAHDGIVVEARPASLTIAAGESAEVAVHITVDNAKVPYPEGGSMSYAGLVEVRSGDEVLRIPWALVKAARLRVHYNSDREAFVFIGPRITAGRVLRAVDWNLFESLLTPGSYNLALVSFASVDPDAETTIIVRDAQQIDGEREIELSPSDAPYRVAYNALDESGAPLRHEGSPIDCLPFRFLRFEWPSWGFIGIDLLYAPGRWTMVTTYPPDIRTSTLDDHYSILAGESCADATLSNFYVLQYPIVRGVSGDLSRDAGGAELRAQKARLVFPGPTDGERILMLESLFRYGPTEGGYSPGFLWARWPRTEWDGTVYLAKEKDPDFSLQPMFEAQTNQSLLSTSPVRVVENGVASFSSSTPSPTTYAASALDPLEFGLGAVTPQLEFTGSLQMNFSGQLEESVHPEGPVQYRLYDRDGQLVSAGTGTLGIGDLSQAMRLEVETPRSHTVQTRSGRTLVTARFGGPQTDRLPPTITSLVVYNAASRPADRLGRGSNGRLVFSAIDSPDDGPAQANRTKVWFRASGSADWLPLPVAVRGDDFNDPGHDPRGTIFECPLTEIARQEGFFDLRISVEDASGNSIDTTIEPALAVTPIPPRTRATRR